MGYVELHCHSAYSFLDGASQPEELAARAAELGYEALALTDHDGVYGSLEFAHAAKAFGLRPITGAEVTLEGGAHVTLLVETPQGLREPLPAAHRGARGHPAEGGRRAAAARSCRSSRCSQTPTVSSASRAARGTAWDARPERSRARRGSVRPGALLRRAPAPVRTRRRPPQRRACASSPATSASPPSPPATSTPTTSGAAPSRTRSSRSAAAPRSTAASTSGAATTRPSCSRPQEMVDRFPQDRDAVAPHRRARRPAWPST